jgi:phenylalanyl-tRNA synthetase beta chain
MNILIPDRWLRQHLETKATVQQIREYLSLCGPSIERVNTVGKDIVYDIEVTTNRVDMMSVRGIAREASSILPQFGIPAKLIPMPSQTKNESKKTIGITIDNDPALCQRIIAVKIDNISLKKSPAYIADFLTLVGVRPMNAAVDITNFVMYEVGHPLHAFDYDRLKEKHIVVRVARKGEHFVTLDDKHHTTQGGEIIFDDGKGIIIDLPGIMGCENTSVHDDTKSILLWTESADSTKIRQTSMGLGIRSQAAIINEKHPDPELAMGAITRALHFYSEIFGKHISSSIEDIYPVQDPGTTISVANSKICSYIGEEIPFQKTIDILSTLGCSVRTSQKKDDVTFSVSPPTFRQQDITIEEDIIEEVARIYGYHRIAPLLPATSAVPKAPEPLLVWEKLVKSSLAYWGYTELYTYSMISQKLLEQSGYDANSSLRVTNPLVTDHEFMRPNLLPSVLQSYANNVRIRENLKLFELSNVYGYQSGALPKEKRMLVVVSSGQSYRELKGIAEAIFGQMGVPIPTDIAASDNPLFDKDRSLKLGSYGSVGYLDAVYLKSVGIEKDVASLELSFDALVSHQNHHVSYEPIPKYPSIIEDLSFAVPTGFKAGPCIEALRHTDVRITSISLIDMYKDTRTIRVVYSDATKNLTNEDVKPIRERLIKKAQEHYNAILRV